MWWWKFGNGEVQSLRIPILWDDMTVVIEGKMSVQFFKKDGEKLVEDGKPLILNKGDAGYIEGGRIHDAKYLEDCKLVYVHDKQFGFDAAAVSA